MSSAPNDPEAPKRVALASCKHIPEPDPDEGMLVEALTRAGIDARVLAWDDPAAPFAEHDLVVLRSTWNYHEDVDAFLAWLTETSKTVPFLNPPAIVFANARKTYLRDLAARGIATVPTEFVPRGSALVLDEVLGKRGWNAFVIKPVVSAGSFRTRRFDARELAAGSAFLEELTAERDVMVQQWMPSVNTYGERSLVWIAGEVTHAVRKSPRFAGGEEVVSGQVEIAADERAFAERVLRTFASELLYARVDMVRDDGGVLRVMELELIEPSLFFAQAPRAALERFVAAIADRLRRDAAHAAAVAR